MSQYNRQSRTWHLGGSFIIAGLVLSSVLLPVSHALPGDYTWRQIQPTNLQGDQIAWVDSASSADGAKLVAVADSSIYTSSDSGLTWSEHRQDATSFSGVASSADGTKLAAADNGSDSVFISADSGMTWQKHQINNSFSLPKIASSADGTKLAATGLEYDYNTGSYTSIIYTSADSGVTWTQRKTVSGMAEDIASSADGTKLVTATQSGYIYTSADSGVTWTTRTSAGFRSWQSVASSSDGVKLVAVGDSDVYTSTNSGVSWTKQAGAGSHFWYEVASSSDGAKLIACEWGGFVYTSSDSGVTWTTRTSAGSRSWGSVTSSSDGAKVVALEQGGSVYASINSGASWVQQRVNGARKWQKIVVSADGSKLAAIVGGSGSSNGGYIYTSSDSGATWAEHSELGKISWASIGMSADGSKIYATHSRNNYDVTMARSLDGGTTWEQLVLVPGSVATSDNPGAVVVSPDGNNVVIMSYYGSIVYTSTDSGTTWARHTYTDSYSWWGASITSVAMSEDASTIVAISSNQLFISRDFAESWESQNIESKTYMSVAISADGSKIFAAYPAVYLSGGYAAWYVARTTNGGATWEQQQVGQYLADQEADSGFYTQPSVVTSTDGTHVVFASGSPTVDNYTSDDSGVTWRKQTNPRVFGCNQGCLSAASNDGSTIVTAGTDEFGHGAMYLGTLDQDPVVDNFQLSTLGASKQGSHHKAFTNSALKVTSTQCYGLDHSSIATLDGSGTTLPAGSNATLLGGLQFNVSCVTPGKSTSVVFTLGAYYPDLSQLRVFKTKADSSGTLEDVTDKVTITNDTVNGASKTTLTYTLVDGGLFDEDGAVNGVIVDPIYLAAVTTSSVVPGSNANSSNGSLAATGSDIWALLLGAGTLIGLGAAMTMRTLRRRIVL